MLIPSLFEKLQIANWLSYSETYLPIATLLLRCELFIFSFWLTPCHTSHSLVIAQPQYCFPMRIAFIDKLDFPICPHKQHGCDEIKNEWNLPIKSTWGLRGRVRLLEGGPFKYNVNINNNLMGCWDHKEMRNEIWYPL